MQKLHSQPGLSKMCDDLPFFTKTQYLFSGTRTLRLVPHPAAASFCQDVWPYFTFSCLHFDLVLLGRIAHFEGGGGGATPAGTCHPQPPPKKSVPASIFSCWGPPEHVDTACKPLGLHTNFRLITQICSLKLPEKGQSAS